MRKTYALIIGALALFVALSTQAQGIFQNLNFELANPGTTFSFAVPISSALPDWAAAIGGVQQTDIGVNAISTGAPYVSLIAPGGSVPAIDGNYSVLLTGSFGESAAISQSGLIPASTQSLFFEANNISEPGTSGTLELLVGTQVVPFAAAGTEPNYTLYAANISAWADDPEPLTFSALQDNTALNNWEIDDITFSPTPLPEPSPLALTAVGGLLFALYRRVSPKPAKSGSTAKNVI